MAYSYQPTAGGSRVTYDVTAITVIKPTPGQIVRVFVNTAPTGIGGIYNAATTGAAAASNLLSSIPSGTVGPIYCDAPMDVGIVVDPGTGGVVSVSYD